MALKHESFEDLFTATADAIRTQNGSSDPITADNFPEEILNLTGKQILSIGSNGNWYINDEDTGKSSKGTPGEKGDKGDAGAGVQSMTYNSSTNKWTVTLTDGSTLTVDGPAIPDVSAYMPKSGGTFSGAIQAATAATGSYYVRNIKFSTTAETPTAEGDICFKLA